MTARVVINEGCAVALDAVRPTANTGRGVLLSLEGRTPGDTMNCALIPLDKIGAVIASLQLVAEQARRA